MLLPMVNQQISIITALGLHVAAGIIEHTNSSPIITALLNTTEISLIGLMDEPWPIVLHAH